MFPSSAFLHFSLLYFFFFDPVQTCICLQLSVFNRRFTAALDFPHEAVHIASNGIPFSFTISSCADLKMALFKWYLWEDYTRLCGEQREQGAGLTLSHRLLVHLGILKVPSEVAHTTWGTGAAPEVEVVPAHVQARDITHLSPRGHASYLTPSLGEGGLGLLPSTEQVPHPLWDMGMLSPWTVSSSTAKPKTKPQLLILFWTNNFILGNASIHCTFSHCGI